MSIFSKGVNTVKHGYFRYKFIIHLCCQHPNPAKPDFLKFYPKGHEEKNRLLKRDELFFL